MLKELIAEFCPHGVEFLPIKKICIKISSGGTPKSSVKEFYNGKISWLRTQDIDWNEITKTSMTITEEGLKNSSAKWIPANCVIVAMYGATTGKVAVNKIPLTTNQACCNLQVDEKIADYKFVYYCLASNYKVLKSMGEGSQNNINSGKIKNFKIPIPPLPVQNEIVRILDTFTELISLLTEELTLRKKQYEYYRDKLLTFDNVPIIKLGEIGKVSMCKRIMKNETSDSGEIPFYKIGTFGKTADAFISRELFEKYRKNYSYPNKGDILISAAGTIGKTVIFDGEPAYFQDSNIVWVANDEAKVLNKFLYYWYQKISWKVSKGGTIARLYNDDISNAKIPVPPIEEQERIVEILDKFDKLCNDLCEGIPAEIAARKKQYEYYRDLLLNFET